MSSPRTEQEWESLFKKKLPDVPLPRGVARRQRDAVATVLQGSRGNTSGLWDRMLRAAGMGRLLSHSRALVFVSSAMVVLLVVSVVFLGAPPRRAYAASVRVLDGTATIVQASSGAAMNIRSDEVASLEPGDELSTQTGTAVITYFSDQTTRVSPGARVKLVKMTQEGNATDVELAVWEGRTSIELGGSQGPEDSFQVTSPSSTASVSDATATVTVDVRSDQETRYVAGTGKVSVTAGGKTVDVHAGELAVATSGQGVAVGAASPVELALASPSPTPTPSDTPLPTTLPSPESVGSVTPLPGLTPTMVFETVTATRPADTATPLPTVTPLPTLKPTLLPTQAPLPSPSSTPLPAPTLTIAPTSVPVPVLVPTETVAPVPAETATPLPAPTATPTELPAATSTLAPTDVPTGTPAPTETPTETPELTATPTYTLTPLPTTTDTPTPIPTPTNTPAPLPTDTPAVLPTDTPLPEPTSTPTPALTYTATPIGLPPLTETPVVVSPLTVTVVTVTTPPEVITDTPVISGSIEQLPALTSTVVISSADVAHYQDQKIILPLAPVDR